MRKTLVLALALLFNSLAYGVQASRESVEALFEISGAESLTSLTNAYMDRVVRQIMKQTLKGDVPSAEQQRRSDALYATLLPMVRREFNWEAMRPRFVQLYQDTFDQAEIDGFIAFYRSPAGRAFAAKSPALEEKLAQLGTEVATSLIPKLKQAAATAASSASVPAVGGVACPTMVPPQMPTQAIALQMTGVVRAKVTILKGTVTDVKILSGPEIFHEPVIAALKQYQCSYSDTAIDATQEFFFKTAELPLTAPPASKMP